MKKRIFIGILLVFSLVIISCNLHEKNLKIDDNNILGIYLDNELQTSIPKKGEAVFSKAVCDNDEVNYYWDIDNWGLYINNLSNKIKCNLYFVNYSGQTVFDFDYTGAEQTFIAPVSGTYKLETWGAQGATDSEIYYGGYGGYSTGIINLVKNENLYVFIGGRGKNINSKTNIGTVYGYPNGGAVSSDGEDSNAITYSSGGGSTHIGKENKFISVLSPLSEFLLIVSGGGGGACNWWNFGDNGGSAGGYKGSTTNINFPNNGVANNNPGVGTQSSGGTGGGNLDGFSSDTWLNGIFGVGGGSNINYKHDESLNVSCGGGGGYYGGGASWGGSGAGGSGYIGNPLLKDKAMYCYYCEESNEESTKTISTTCSEEAPTSYCAKKGNGYARITLVSIDS